MKILDLTTDAATIAIADIAQQKLRESPYYFLKNLTCQFNEGVLTLHGDVPIFPLKHLAEGYALPRGFTQSPERSRHAT